MGSAGQSWDRNGWTFFLVMHSDELSMLVVLVGIYAQVVVSDCKKGYCKSDVVLDGDKGGKHFTFGQHH